MGPNGGPLSQPSVVPRVSRTVDERGTDDCALKMLRGAGPVQDTAT